MLTIQCNISIPLTIANWRQRICYYSARREDSTIIIRHIKDPEIIELEDRVSPISHPPQSSEEMIIRPQSKTITVTMCELSSLPPHISGCGEDESNISG